MFFRNFTMACAAAALMTVPATRVAADGRDFAATHMGYAATGQLTDYEKSFLLQSYNRALAGGAATNQLIAASPTGPRGLLTTYRAQAAGVAPAVPGAVAPATTTVVAVAPQPVQLQPQVLGAGTTTTTTTVTAVAGAGAAAGAATLGGTALPNFMGQTATVSLASHCNQVSLLTSTNGGFMTAETMIDANFALNEQFCLARTYAIAEGEQLAAAIQGFTPEQIAQPVRHGQDLPVGGLPHGQYGRGAGIGAAAVGSGRAGVWRADGPPLGARVWDVETLRPGAGVV